jgi:hypothetical protein
MWRRQPDSLRKLATIFASTSATGATRTAADAARATAAVQPCQHEPLVPGRRALLSGPLNV